MASKISWEKLTSELDQGTRDDGSIVYSGIFYENRKKRHTSLYPTAAEALRAAAEEKERVLAGSCAPRQKPSSGTGRSPKHPGSTRFDPYSRASSSPGALRNTYGQAGHHMSSGCVSRGTAGQPVLLQAYQAATAGHQQPDAGFQFGLRSGQVWHSGGALQHPEQQDTGIAVPQRPFPPAAAGMPPGGQPVSEQAYQAAAAAHQQPDAGFQSGHGNGRAWHSGGVLQHPAQQECRPDLLLRGQVGLNAPAAASTQVQARGGQVAELLQAPGPESARNIVQGTVLGLPVQHQQAAQHYSQPFLQLNAPVGSKTATQLNAADTQHQWLREAQPPAAFSPTLNIRQGVLQQHQPPPSGSHSSPAMLRQPMPASPSGARRLSTGCDGLSPARALLHSLQLDPAVPAGLQLAPLVTPSGDLDGARIQGQMVDAASITPDVVAAATATQYSTGLRAAVGAPISTAVSATAGLPASAGRNSDAVNWCGRYVSITECYDERLTDHSVVLLSVIGEGSYGLFLQGIAAPTNQLEAAGPLIRQLRQASALGTGLAATAAASARSFNDALAELKRSLINWKFVAVKYVKPVDGWQQRLRTEVTAMKLLQDLPNGVYLLAEGVIEQQQQQQQQEAGPSNAQQQQLPCFVMEYVRHSLESELLWQGPFDEQQLKQVVQPLLQVFAVMQSGNLVLDGKHVVIAHRDLKAANVLLQQRVGQLPIPKLADFGSAKIVEVPAPLQPAAAAAGAAASASEVGPYHGLFGGTPPAAQMHSAVVGTPLFCDAVVVNPSMRLGRGYGLSADSFSLGAMVAQGMAGSDRFLQWLARDAMTAPGGLNANYQLYTQRLEELLTGNIQFPQELVGEVLSGRVRGSVRHFIGSCCGLLGYDKQLAHELLTHPWLQPGVPVQAAGSEGAH